MLAPHISVVNLGCRVNRVESDRITADLMRLGFAMVEPQDAELIVINTWCRLRRGRGQDP